jgi:N-methylhydantoinase A
MVGARLKEKLPNAFITTSHEILREYREYERISTTVVNAYIGPTVGGYIKQLGARLTGAGFTGELSIMQSNGGVMHPDTAALRPVTMMESGPVGGIIASARIGAALGYPSTIAFDMGGTTAKASLIYDAAPTMAEGYYVGGYANGHPVMTPVIDVVEVGTGGGSIAWIDEVGALKVGPRSAGAEPGPICYRRGGTDPTITDANVVLGRIGAEQFLGGEMKLDAAGAAVGLEKIGKPLGLDAVATARAVVDIAVAKMSLAVREVSVAKGFDPREFALVASGGAGPLHVIAVARELHVPTVIVPCFPAHFSALGMLMADERHDLVRTHFSLLSAVDFAQVRGMRAELVREAKADLRYIGQEFALAVPVTDAQLDGDHAGIRKAFDEMHEQRYAHHAKDEPVEMIAIRLVATGARPKLAMPPVNGKRAAPKPVTRKVHLGGTAAVDCPVYQRDDLAAGFAFDGPALVQEYASTTVMLAGDSAKIADTGEIVISVGRG